MTVRIRELLDTHFGPGADKRTLLAHIAAYEGLVPALLDEVEAARMVRLEWRHVQDRDELFLLHALHSGAILKVAYIKPSSDGQYLWKCCGELFMYKVPTRDDALSAVADCFPLWKIPAMLGRATE